MSVCMSVHCMFGHFNIWSWPNVQYDVFGSHTGSVTPKITGKAHENRRPTSVFRHGSSRPLFFPCRNHKGLAQGPLARNLLSPGLETGKKYSYRYCIVQNKYIATSCLISCKNYRYCKIKGERTRVEKQMLGGGFRALYRWFSASLNRYGSH